MKRINILSFFFIISICSFSQISLTFKNNALKPGDTSTYIKIPFVDPGGSGPEQVWDFSKIEIKGEKVVTAVSVNPAEKANNSGDFNIILNERGSDYFFKQDETSFTEVRGITKDYTLNFKDPMLKMIYPFSFGSKFTDDFSGLAVSPSSPSIEFSGVYSVTADAYGTIVFPNSTYENVLRVKTESKGLEVNQCNSIETKTVRYLWYAPNHRYPVMNEVVTENRISGKEAEVTKSAMLWSVKTIDTLSNKGQVQDIVANDDFTVVFINPNPFTDRLNYHYMLRKPVSVSITMTDITGRSFAVLMKGQMQGEGLHSGIINASEFNMNPGMYYLRFVLDKQVVVKKVIKL